ncbi:hypothetical protein Acr_00g0049860 [Actinidia rufa]|uniref:Uncharacterized protein n=1 Tax=Actinidia rufa TaxID=165716 RepID=A0A7J0DKM4_9ERIC|nr:hypothetical protein Acr_00g0049860 [Actinidia rufa]
MLRCIVVVLFQHRTRILYIQPHILQCQLPNSALEWPNCQGMSCIEASPPRETNPPMMLPSLEGPKQDID